MAWPVHEIRLYGHRGSSARLPENTLDAFRLALTDGANALELDVHRTRDGHFVVCHDPSGLRMAGVGESICHSTLVQVKRWDVGAGFVDRGGARPHAGRGFEIPTLLEVLQEFPGVPMSLDLKPNDPAAVPSLLALLAAHGAEANVTVASFHDAVVRAARRGGYAGRTALTRAEVVALRLLPLSMVRPLVRGQAALIPLRTGPIRLDHPLFMRRCRALGMRVDYWVVNDREQAVRLLDCGATGVMTDDPRAILPALRDRLAAPGCDPGDPGKAVAAC